MYFGRTAALDWPGIWRQSGHVVLVRLATKYKERAHSTHALRFDVESRPLSNIEHRFKVREQIASPDPSMIHSVLKQVIPYNCMYAPEHDVSFEPIQWNKHKSMRSITKRNNSTQGDWLTSSRSYDITQRLAS